MEKRSFFSRLAGSMKETPLSAPKKNAATQAHQHHKERSIGTEQCALDVYQTNDELVITVLIAGVHPDDLDISLSNDTLTIRGIRTEKDPVPPQDYYYRECYYGPFSRSIILPENSHGDSIKATLKNGILIIRLPKAEKKFIPITQD